MNDLMADLGVELMKFHSVNTKLMLVRMLNSELDCKMV